MTREEAIEKLRLFDFIGSNEDEEFLTALDMAIKAIQQWPTRVIDELENIKLEMVHERDSVDLSCADSFNWNIRLIDKHIADCRRGRRINNDIKTIS